MEAVTGREIDQLAYDVLPLLVLMHLVLLGLNVRDAIFLTEHDKETGCLVRNRKERKGSQSE